MCLMPYFRFLSTYRQKASIWNDSFIYTFMSPNRKYFLTVWNECIENIGNSCCRVTCFLSSWVDESSNLKTTNNISHPFTDLTPWEKRHKAFTSLTEYRTQHHLTNKCFYCIQVCFQNMGILIIYVTSQMIPALNYLLYTTSECHFFCKNEMPHLFWSLIGTYMNGRS